MQNVKTQTLQGPTKPQSHSSREKIRTKMLCMPTVWRNTISKFDKEILTNRPVYYTWEDITNQSKIATIIIMDSKLMIRQRSVYSWQRWGKLKLADSKIIDTYNYDRDLSIEKQALLQL